MALPKPLHEDHEVLGDENYCPGYVDAYGIWNNGFPCPILSSIDPPVYCCGTPTYKYCCTGHDGTSAATANTTTAQNARLPLLLGVLLGAVVALIIVVVVSCLHCSCCLLYKKRQPSSNAGGPMYQLQGGTTSGVPNMYSFNRNATPRRSVSRSDSSSSSVSNRHSLSSLRLHMTDPHHHHSRYGGGGANGPLHGTTTAGRSDCGSLISSLSSSATPSDSTTRAPLLPPSPTVDHPPPYSPPPPQPGPHSTMVAVRTSLPPPCSTATLHRHHRPIPSRLRQDNSEVFVVGSGDSGCVSGMFSTFTQPGMLPSSTSVSNSFRSCNTLPLTTTTLLEHHLSTTPTTTADQNPFLLINNHRSYLNNNHRSSTFLNNTNNNNLNDIHLNVNTNPQFYNIVNNNQTSASNSDEVPRFLRSLPSYHQSSMSPMDDSTASGSSANGKESPSLLPATPATLHYLHDTEGEAYRRQHHHHYQPASNTSSVGSPTQPAFLAGHKSGYGAPVGVVPPPPPLSFSPALTPTTRPCSTAHIIHTASPGAEGGEETDELDREVRLCTATKF